MLTSLCEMKKRSELKMKWVFNTLMKISERLICLMWLMPHWECELINEHLHVLCHWEGDYSQFEKELRKWKKFLNYQQRKEVNERTEMQLKEQQSTETMIQVNLWKNYQIYQQLKINNAKQWMKFWQQQMKECQNTENHCTLQEWASTAEQYHFNGERMKLHVKNTQKQVQPAEMQLKWIEEQLSALFAECTVSTMKVSTSDPLKNQVMPLKRASRSSQITLKDLRFNQSIKLTLQSFHHCSSANSVLDSIHSSKVSKTAERTALHCQQQFKILAEHDDSQNQVSNITISSVLPVNVGLCRSSQLSDKKMRSDALKASLAVNLSKSAHSAPIILCRSDQILKQNERMSLSTSSAAVNSAVILQTDLSQCLSWFKLKGCCAGNKSDLSSVKPWEIIKRQESNFSWNRIKIHS